MPSLVFERQPKQLASGVVYIVPTEMSHGSMQMRASRWCVLLCFHRFSHANIYFQISVINDMTAIPVFMTQSLNTAKGTLGHSAAQAVKGAAYGAVNLVSGTSEDKS